MADAGNIDCPNLLSLLLLLLQENFETFCLSDSKSVHFKNKNDGHLKSFSTYLGDFL